MYLHIEMLLLVDTLRKVVPQLALSYTVTIAGGARTFVKSATINPAGFKRGTETIHKTKRLTLEV